MPETPLSFSHQHIVGREQEKDCQQWTAACRHSRWRKFLVRSQSCTAPGRTWSYQLHSPPVRAGISPTLARCRNARTHETAGEGIVLSPSLLHERKVSVCRSSSCIAFHRLSMEEVERLAGLPLIQIQNPRLCSRGKGSRGSTCPHCRSRVGCFVGKTYRNIGDTLSGTKT